MESKEPGDPGGEIDGDFGGDADGEADPLDETEYELELDDNTDMLYDGCWVTPASLGASSTGVSDTPFSGTAFIGVASTDVGAFDPFSPKGLGGGNRFCDVPRGVVVGVLEEGASPFFSSNFNAPGASCDLKNGSGDISGLEALMVLSMVDFLLSIG